MNETMVTLTGWVGGEVTMREAGDSVVANFRVGSTPRRYSRKSGEWVDGETQWHAVSAWRTLGENCRRSLRRGDPVVVHGRQTAETYVNRDGVWVTKLVVEALVVGHDLNRGSSNFLRNPRVTTVVATREEPPAPADCATEEGPDQPADAAAA